MKEQKLSGAKSTLFNIRFIWLKLMLDARGLENFFSTTRLWRRDNICTVDDWFFLCLNLKSPKGTKGINSGAAKAMCTLHTHPKKKHSHFSYVNVFMRARLRTFFIPVNGCICKQTRHRRYMGCFLSTFNNLEKQQILLQTVCHENLCKFET